jgi:hypothetical protein
LVSAVTYLMAKDRAFDDPLRTVGSSSPTHAQATSPVIILQTSSSESLSLANKEEEEVELKTAATMDIAMVDGLSESSDEDDNDLNDDEELEGELGNIFIEEEGLNGVQDELEIKAATMKSVSSVVSSTQPSVKPISQHKPVPQTTVTSRRAPQSSDDRPVLVFPNGFILHDKVSISVSVHHVTIQGTYGSSVDGHIQIVANGVVAEAIWPQITKVRANSDDRPIVVMLAHLSHFAVRYAGHRRGVVICKLLFLMLRFRSVASSGYDRYSSAARSTTTPDQWKSQQNP